MKIVLCAVFACFVLGAPVGRYYVRLHSHGLSYLRRGITEHELSRRAYRYGAKHRSDLHNKKVRRRNLQHLAITGEHERTFTGTFLGRQHAKKFVREVRWAALRQIRDAGGRLDLEV